MTPYTEVLFEEIPGQGGSLGVITLNRPSVLNSLNHDMIHAMTHQLTAWRSDAQIKAVIIRAAEGRAFCAGGDLRLTYDRIKAHDPIMSGFFHDEYQLNSLIFHFPKPYIALLDGITMGGGVGISIHGSHRVATDRLLFAMPETGIGFFPDVGGSYFLPRLTHEMGTYLGLTGARLSADECVHLGIAQHKIAQDKLNALVDELAQTPFAMDANAQVLKIISSYAVNTQPSQLLTHQAAIQACFGAQTMEAVLQALHESDDAICKDAIAILSKKSPTSLKVTLRALQRGRQLSFDDCMIQEYRLVCRFLQGHDFIEGIRAVIIDKDQTPQWKPATLADVTMQDVEHYFAPLERELMSHVG